ncbi:PREDICTED: putative UPF0481 protein At3g02645 [Ipomoea nil]|uniref:putative UPF0481 protein At3g02645 n=1 Tax=Ipomoea nil TaxID=35883 RepID=UPI000901100B|nr:PREDICTED: putative UPF0481 protein At3g02645 [Ipomoea nil]
MSAFPSDMPSNSGASFDERRWVIHVRQSLDEEIEEESETPVSIFSVPKNLMVADPDSYVPQLVAIGPYHYWRPELYDMERYKLAAAKRTQKNLHTFKFHHLVDQVTKYEHRIRAHYHKFLNFNCETLGWMVAVDASFLLEFLQVYAAQEGKVRTGVSSRMSHLVDISGRKSAHNAILRDMLMLENQIPLFVLRKMLEFQSSSLEVANNTLMCMLIGFCKEVSPFKMVEVLPKVEIKDCAHLLDVVYHLIVPKCEGCTTEITEEGDGGMTPITDHGENTSFGQPSSVRQLADEVWKIVVKIHKGPARLIKRVVLSRPVKVMLKLPWKLLSNLPGLKFVLQPIAYLCLYQEKDNGKPESENPPDSDKPPLVEEIAIPSVTELFEAGVSFVPTKEGIASICFDDKKVALYLPRISLDLNTEVLLRNLVAYEACNASGPVVFTRYTELMNGIIDTEEDARVLRERGIILNRLKSDGDVAKLWNGMSRSVRLTKVPFLDKAIEDVNKYYNGRWKVKMGNLMKEYVFESWRFLTLLAAIMLLLLMSLQAICSVYSCARLFHLNTNSTSTSRS